MKIQKNKINKHINTFYFHQNKIHLSQLTNIQEGTNYEDK